MKDVKYSFEDWCIENNMHDLLSKWDYDLNDISPSEIAKNSNKRIFFTCGNKNHESISVLLYSITIKRVIRCVQCNSFYNWCVSNGHTDYLDLWDYELNNVLPTHILPHTKYKAYFKCPDNRHESFQKELQVLARDLTLSCKRCNSFEQWCLDNNHQDYLDLWDYDLNKCSPSDVNCNTTKKIWFKCSRGIHKSHSRHLTVLIRGTCTSLCKECNSFGQYLIDEFGSEAIAKYWSCENRINPFRIAKNSKSKIFIKCAEHDAHKCYETEPHRFITGCRCPICVSKKVIKGINDIATTHPHLVKYFNNKDDAFTYSHGSNKTILSICPNCKTQKLFKISDLSTQRHSCDRCGDGISYPEKFIYSFLSQLKCDFKKQLSAKTFKWCEGYRYDFYIDKIKTIIETHGSQHYSYGFESYGGKTVIQERDNDKLKKELALHNGVNTYIELDCRISEVECIKNSIMNSSLPRILNFKEGDIDWLKCGEDAISSKMIEACSLWNSGHRDVKEISSIIDITFTNVTIYLKKCASLGLCDYNPIIEQQKGLINLKNNSKKVVVLEDNRVFNSIKELCDKSLGIYGVRFDRTTVSDVCNGKRKHNKGYHFKFV